MLKVFGWRTGPGEKLITMYAVKIRPQQGSDASHTVDNMARGTSINDGAADWVGFIVRSRDAIRRKRTEGHDWPLNCLIATEQTVQCADRNQLLTAMLSLCTVCRLEPTPVFDALTVPYPLHPLCSLCDDELPSVHNIHHATQTWSTHCVACAPPHTLEVPGVGFAVFFAAGP